MSNPLTYEERKRLFVLSGIPHRTTEEELEYVNLKTREEQEADCGVNVKRSSGKDRANELLLTALSAYAPAKVQFKLAKLVEGMLLDEKTPEQIAVFICSRLVEGVQHGDWEI